MILVLGNKLFHRSGESADVSRSDLLAQGFEASLCEIYLLFPQGAKEKSLGYVFILAMESGWP